MIIVTPGSSRRYVLQDERDLPESEQSVFLLRALTLAQIMKIEDAAASVSPGDNTVNIRSGSSKVVALEQGLEGWENVRDANGNQIKFKGTKKKVKGETVIQPDMETLSLIPPKYRNELAEEITNGSQLDEETEGNSSKSDSNSSEG